MLSTINIYLIIYFNKYLLLIIQEKIMTNYTGSNIKVLKGLDAVRKRPGMYIGDTDDGSGLHHMLFEVLDNSIDEALAGYCDKIDIEINTDNSISVLDNGRGIPTDIHPTENKPTVEVVLTELHSGGKFDQNSYSVSGGLHGVGISVVNALSSWLKVEVFRGKKVSSLSFVNGVVSEPLKEYQVKKKMSGTKITFLPSLDIFSHIDYSSDIIQKRLYELSFLNPSLTISFLDSRKAEPVKLTYQSDAGIIDYLNILTKKYDNDFCNVIELKNNIDTINHIPINLDIVFKWTNSYAENVRCFTNNIPQSDGGTHLSGFRSGVTKAINQYISEYHPKLSHKISSDDIREGLYAIISVKFPDPKFSSQTKEKLVSSEVVSPISNSVSSLLFEWMTKNKIYSKKIITKIIKASETREAAKKARELSRRQNLLDLNTLPGKLSNCQSRKPSDCELFIVEGDSAGGTAKQGRSKLNQAVLPLRGKVLNVERSKIDKIIKSDQIGTLISALGCGIGDSFDISKLRYHKIIIMTDADVDGSHIKTLLLTFFYRYLPDLLHKNYIYVAQPPLYSIGIKKSKKYFLNDQDLNRYFLEQGIKNIVLKINNKKLDLSETTNFLHQIDTLISDLNRLYRLIDDNRVASALAVSGALHPKAFSSYEFIDKTKEHLLKVLSAQYPTIEWYGAIESDSIKISHLDSGVHHPSFIPFDLHKTSFSKNLVLSYSFLTKTFLKGISVKSTEVNSHFYDPIEFYEFIKARGSNNLQVQRYKGLGEMNKDQLWDTTMNPDYRTLLRVGINDIKATNNLFSVLMGDNVEPRKDYIVSHSLSTKNLDI